MTTTERNTQQRPSGIAAATEWDDARMRLQLSEEPRSSNWMEHLAPKMLVGAFALFAAVLFVTSIA